MHVCTVPDKWPPLNKSSSARSNARIRRADSTTDRTGERRAGAATQRRPRLEVAQLDAENRALQPLHPVVVAPQHVVVLLRLTPVAQHADRLGVAGVARRDEAAFAAGAKVLARIEAETREVADAADAAAAVLRAVRLARVFDDDQIALARDGENRIHIGGLSVDVDRKNR